MSRANFCRHFLASILVLLLSSIALIVSVGIERSNSDSDRTTTTTSVSTLSTTLSSTPLPSHNESRLLLAHYNNNNSTTTDTTSGNSSGGAIIATTTNTTNTTTTSSSSSSSTSSSTSSTSTSTSAKVVEASESSEGSMIILPLANCTRVGAKICYEGNQSALNRVLAHDPLSCKPPLESVLVAGGRCEHYGFTHLIGPDPVFRNVDLFTPPTGPHLWFRGIGMMPSKTRRSKIHASSSSSSSSSPDPSVRGSYNNRLPPPSHFSTAKSNKDNHRKIHGVGHHHPPSYTTTHNNNSNNNSNKGSSSSSRSSSSSIRGNLSYCAEVDAALYMPASLFEPQFAKTLREYVDLVLKGGWNGGGGGPGEPVHHYHIEEGKCADVGYANYATTLTRNWVTEAIDVDRLCGTFCNCSSATSITSPTARHVGGSDGYGSRNNYIRKCPDVPDDPKNDRWCSLCGNPAYIGLANFSLFSQ